MKLVIQILVNVIHVKKEQDGTLILQYVSYALILIVLNALLLQQNVINVEKNMESIHHINVKSVATNVKFAPLMFLSAINVLQIMGSNIMELFLILAQIFVNFVVRNLDVFSVIPPTPAYVLTVTINMLMLMELANLVQILNVKIVHLMF